MRSTCPVLRLKRALRRHAESALDEGGSLSEFVTKCAREGIKWRRAQDDFLVRARDAVERGVRENSGITVQELLKQMDDRIEAASLGRRPQTAER